VDTALSDALVGQVLDGRYQVESRIARGGMATVYKALDRRLDRIVALKVMHPALAEDEEFVRRFIREARSAARLSHPNVVSVFDQGEDGGHVFLAMEYVEGRTLRAVLRERGRLSAAQALAVLEPVLAALAAAHRAGLVHRDVKPENVLLADDGRVKVADFGLARAVTGANLTGTTGVLIGTVAYLAPEQVEHGKADARTDVYSAGILLFEMLVGRPPYDGETALSVAYKHVNADVPAPSTLVGGVPENVDTLVRTATRRDPAARYADAEAFLIDAARVRRGGVPNDPGPVVAPSRPGVGDAPTTAVPRALPASADTVHHTQVLPPLPAEGGPDVPPDPQPRTGRWRPRRGLIAALIIVLLAVLAGVGGWWYGAGRYTHAPAVLKLDQTAATAKLRTDGLKVHLGSPVFSDVVDKDLVASQTPAPGDRVRKGGTVTLHLSKGPEVYAVPDLAGSTLDAAKSALAATHLAVGDVTEQYSDTVAKGQVISTDPAPGTVIRHDTAVSLVVSKGVQPVTVPNVANASQADATKALTGALLKVKVAQANSTTVPKGSVISQDVAPGTVVPKGTTVTITVSQGPPMVAVPDVVGQNVQQATQVLQAAGFQVAVVRAPFGPGKVYDQSPKGQAPQGSKVTLYVV
jgi:serine/threonine-protein kinase